MNHEPCKDIHYQWSADETCIDCPCGTKEIIFSESGCERTCDCGRMYKLIHFIALIKEAKKKK